MGLLRRLVEYIVLFSIVEGSNVGCQLFAVYSSYFNPHTRV